MATKAIWNKWGLRLECETSRRPLPKVAQAWPVPDFGQVSDALIQAALELDPISGAPGIRVTTIDPFGLPKRTKWGWKLLHCAYQGTAPDPLPWEELTSLPAGRLSYRLNLPMSPAHHRFAVAYQPIVGGGWAELTILPSVLIDTPLSYQVGLQSGVDAAQSTASAAAAAASAAQASANTANADLANIASDSLLTPDEKPRVIQDRDVIVAEQAGIDAQATAYSITTEKTAYDSAVSALTAYLATLTTPTLWSDLGGNTTIVGTTFRTKFSDVYTTRQTLLNKIFAAAKALADAAQSTGNTAISNAATAQSTANAAGSAAAYADLLARSSYNLIKNGNSEDPSPTGYEAVGVVPYGFRTGTKCRVLVGNGSYPSYDITPLIPCSTGDQFYLEAWGYRTATGSGNARVYVVFFNADRTTVAGYTNIEAVTTGYQKYTCSMAAPAGACYVLIRIENDLVPNLVECYWDDFYFCRKISAGMLEADLAILGVIRSPNYVAGAYGTAPTGFKQSGYAFTTTYDDGTTDANCYMELQGTANFGGKKVAVLVNRVMGNTPTYTTPGTYYWTCPEGVTSVKLTLASAGGGASAGVANIRGGGGAQAGRAIRRRITVTPGVTYTIVIGAGGNGGATSGAAGVQGGTSSFSGPGFSTITLTGGLPGAANGDAGGGPAFGTGTSGYASVETNTFLDDGTDLSAASGGPGGLIGLGQTQAGIGGNAWGYGGGNKGTTSNSSGPGGGGGASPLGAGGDGGSAGAAGTNGGTAAGGGAGSCNASTGWGAGGRGGDGYGQISW